MSEKTTEVLQKLTYFQSGVIKKHPPAMEEDILQCEKKLGWAFGKEMKEFLSNSNGIGIIEYHFFGVPVTGVRKIPKDYNIVLWNNRLLRTSDLWPMNWLKLGRDGFGNYLAAISSDEENQVVFSCCWIDHETIGAQIVTPRYIGDYLDLLDYSIDEMISCYGPDGRIKAKSH